MLAQIRVLLLVVVLVVVLAEEKSRPPIAADQGLVPIVLPSSDAVTDQSYDERQARMQLHTESPRAKARRDTILRGMLAARRRKILRQRSTVEATAKVQTTTAPSRRHSMRRKPVVRESPSGDLLEMQESQNGLYVTVPEQQSTNDTTQIVIETLADKSGSKRNNNATTSKPHLQRGNTSLADQQRSKKIVAMSASLYNHFNPVESNIPIEDMSQFLYFGQKLRGTAMGKDSMPASPPPKKKLLAGLQGTIDDEMNSVDRSSIVSSKSTKMRTTSLREHTTKAATTARPDKDKVYMAANIINATDIELTGGADTAAASNLRIVVTEITTQKLTTKASIITSSSTTTTTTTTESPTTIIASTTTEKESLSSTESAVSMSKEQQHVTESTAATAARRALRNSTGAFASSSPSTTQSPQQQQQQVVGSAGATVEQAAPPPRSRSQHQQPGFTIRWTDVRSKRRRLANRRREKSARNMDEQVSSTTTTTTVDPPISPVTEKTLVESSTVSTTTMIEEETNTMDGEEATAEVTTTMRMLDPSEVQKMYRAGSTSSSTTEEVPTTTSTDIPVSSSSRSPDRSPEVRGRNLEDKAKDDVLPIMQLYNTSTMFNASDSSTSTTTTTVLPTEAVPTEPPPSSTTATTTTTSTTPASTTTRPRPRATRTTTTSTTSKPRHEYNNSGYYPLEIGNRTFYEPPAFVAIGGPFVNASEVISRRHDGDALASQETVAVVSYILATLVVFPIAVGVALILRRLILRNRKVLEESDTSSEISCRKDALNLETGDFKTSIEKTITKLPRIQHLCHEAEKPPPPSSQESRWEFPRDKLRLQTVLGEGNFGQVWKAEADDLTGHQGQTRLVAVKTVKEGASEREKEDLVRELAIMQRVGSHPNVVTLLGCCTEQEPHYLILEYVMYGKLLTYLRDHRTRQDFYNFSEDSAALTSRDLTVFGYCVARGMEYLASKKIIHRDMAARNVLVDHNKLCKIADFGMSRFADENGEVIETRHGQRNALPIRWMAPESLIYSLFTTKTDVWSFGILMWEIVTLGSTPYPDMTAREVMRSVQSGYRLERPSHCRSELFRVIARCWHADPDRRPEFAHLRRDLAQLLEDNMNGHYVDLESFASECTD